MLLPCTPFKGFKTKEMNAFNRFDVSNDIHNKRMILFCCNRKNLTVRTSRKGQNKRERNETNLT
jgi:hypothetical protein